MIQCYYSKETIAMVAKSGQRRAIGCGGFWFGLLLLPIVGMAIQNPANIDERILLISIVWCGMGYFFHRLLCNIEKTTLEHARDEITLDDNVIRLVTEDGTQITLPREGLRVQGGYYAAGSVTYNIWNPNVSKDKIVLTASMENARELVDAIRPGAWDTGSG